MPPHARLVCDSRRQGACHSPAARRQSQRDRHSRFPLRPRAGHPHRCHLRARGPLRPAPLQGGRGLSRRHARRTAPRLPRHRQASSPWPANTMSTRSIPATASSRRTPHFARACADAGIIFVGPRSRCSNSSATRWRPADWRSKPRCRSCPAAMSRSSDKAEARTARGEARLSGHRQGVDGRRRPGHARRGHGRQARRGHRPGPARGRHRVRHRRRLPREVSSAGPPHRSAAPRRPARQPGPSLRARLLVAAPPSEGRRDRPGAEPRPATRRAIWDAALAVGRAAGSTTPAPSSSSSTSTRTGSTSSRSTRASRSSTPSPRRSPASTSSRRRS